MENNYCVYVHIAPNGKMYIGITCQKPTRRWHGGHGYRNQTKFFNAIKKYGWDNFFHGIIVDKLSKENACAIEQHLIAFFNTVEKGYNQTSGGESGYNFCHTQETKDKIRRVQLGRTHSPEHNAKCIAQLEKNRMARQRKVYCVETKEIFESIKCAADYYDLHAGHITECCNGKRKTSGKLHWKYWEENDGEMV